MIVRGIPRESRSVPDSLKEKGPIQSDGPFFDARSRSRCGSQPRWTIQRDRRRYEWMEPGPIHQTLGESDPVAQVRHAVAPADEVEDGIGEKSRVHQRKRQV